jgi:hypothetical protein
VSRGDVTWEVNGILETGGGEREIKSTENKR